MPLNPNEVHEEDVRNVGVSYEPRQPDLRVVLAFLASLALAGGLILLILWGMYAYFRGLSAKRGPVPSPEVFGSAPRIPAPKLQPDPVADYQVYQLTDHEILTSYGWVDQKAGIARIPIDRAMDLLVQRGLPWKAPGTGPPPAVANENQAVGPYPGTSREQQDLSKRK